MTPHERNLLLRSRLLVSAGGKGNGNDRRELLSQLDAALGYPTEYECRAALHFPLPTVIRIKDNEATVQL